MGIKLTGWNKAGTAQCFEVSHYFHMKSYHTTRIEKPGVYYMGSARIGAAYVPYTGHWDLFDLRDGSRIATMDREFFEMAFEGHRAFDLVPGCEDDVQPTG